MGWNIKRKGVCLEEGVSENNVAENSRGYTRQERSMNSRERVSADTMFYVKLLLDGEECFVTGACIAHDSVPDGLYSYDMINEGISEKLENLYITKEMASSALAGTLLAKNPIDFQGKQMRCMEEAVLLEDEPLISIDEAMQEETQQMWLS